MMRWLARVFASAIARRFAYVLVAATLAWCGMGKAHAQDYSGCTAAFGHGALCRDQGAAYSEVNRQLQAWSNQNASATPGWSRRVCVTVVDNGEFGRSVNGYVTPYGPSPVCQSNAEISMSRTWPFGNDCKKRPDYNGAFPGALSGTPTSGSMQCDSGCWKVWTPNSDSTWNGTFALNAVCNANDNGCYVPSMHYNANLAMCEPEPPKECPKGQIKKPNGQCTPNQCPEGMTLQQDGTCGPSNNDCPAGQIKSPAGGCLPGEGQCAAGETRGPDGTCKKDGDGDGEPDEEGEGEKSSFSGGDTCDSPPSCSGDAIMCGQARIQWRIDCNTRRDVNINGGGCSSMPICVGKNCKAMEYSQLLLQWRTACALEKASTGGGSGGGDADVKAIRDAITGNGTADIGADGKPADAFSDESGYGEDGYPTGELDTSGFGYSRTCPTIPDVAVFGQTLHFDTSKFCQWMVLGGQIVLVMASLVSLRLMSQGGSA